MSFTGRRGRASAHVLGLDIGTSSVRGIVYDKTAEPVPELECHITYAPLITEDGGVTVDADVFLSLVLEVLDRVSAQATDHSISIDCVGLSCFWHSLVALDADGAPLTPILLWADTRAAIVVDRMASIVAPETLRKRTGASLHASYWPAKLVWLERTQPEIYRRAKHFISAAEFLYHCFFNVFRASISQASGTGLLNIATCEWDPYACSVATSVADRLSPLDDCPLSGMKDSFRKRWPPLADATWFAAVGDGACANIGCGGWSPDRFVVTIGTSSAMRTVIPQSIDIQGGSVSTGCGQTSLWNYRVDVDRGVVGGALGEGGNLVAWLHANLNLPALATAEAQIAERPGNAGRLTMVPFIAGERSPDWDARARLGITGIGMATEPIDILQAALESIAYQLRTVYDAMVECVGRPETVVASGAALGNSPVWRQILANVLERSVTASRVGECSSRGAAILALTRAGSLDFGEADPLFGEVHQPTGDPAIYRAARRRQMRLYDRLRGTWSDVQSDG